MTISLVKTGAVTAAEGVAPTGSLIAPIAAVPPSGPLPSHLGGGALPVRLGLFVCDPLPYDPRPLAGRRILVVDNELAVLHAVTPVLDAWGMRVESTTDPAVARDRLLAEDFDLLITDLVMPEMNGIELINALLARQRFIPTLVLSGSQGNRQAAAMHDDLAGDAFRRLRLPLLYMKKEPERFEERLCDRLRYLARCRKLADRKMVGVRERALPFLHDVLSSDQPPGLAIARLNSEQRQLIDELIDRFCDVRFRVALAEAPLVARLKAFSEALPEGAPMRRSIDSTLWAFTASQYGLHGFHRVDFMQLDARGWHDLKGRLTARRVTTDLTSPVRAGFPSEVRAWLDELHAHTNALVALVDAIHSLLLLADKPTDVSVFEQIRNQQLYVDVRLDVPLEDFTAHFPYRMLRDITLQLAMNARDAVSPEHNPPILRARIVGADDVLVPPDKASAPRYLYIGTINEGPSIPEAIRHKMLQGTPFTAGKPFDSGTGLALVHQYLRTVHGWLDVRSVDGENEVAVYIPLP